MKLSQISNPSLSSPNRTLFLTNEELPLSRGTDTSHEQKSTRNILQLVPISPNIFANTPCQTCFIQSPKSPDTTPTFYQKLPPNKETYLAYVVAIRDPLNLHLDIYWPPEIVERYNTSLHYDYRFISEELEPKIHQRIAYSCHLRGVEIIPNGPNDFTNMKEAYILISKRILRSGGWILVSVGDIDVYRRILINIFDVVTRQSINHELLGKVSERTGEPIAKEYVRPLKLKPMFQPDESVPKDYHIVFTGSPKEQ